MLHTQGPTKKQPARKRELSVRHRQLYALTELNLSLRQRLGADASKEDELTAAIEELTRLIDLVAAQFEAAGAPEHRSARFTKKQLADLDAATEALENWSQIDMPISTLLKLARDVVIVGSVSRHPKPRLIYANA